MNCPLSTIKGVYQNPFLLSFMLYNIRTDTFIIYSIHKKIILKIYLFEESINMLKIILIILSGFGTCWLILCLMVIKFGGSIKVVLQNPITKQNDILTDINITKNKYINSQSQ